MKIAIHVHSTNSDGKFTPAEIMQSVNDSGCKLCAITDHDFITIPDKTDGLIYLPSAEFTANDFSNFHILGYNLQNTQYISAIYKFLNQLNNEKMKEVIERLKQQNIQISYDEVKKFANNKQINKTIIKQFLVYKRYVPNCGDAYKKFMSKNKPAYVKSRDFNAIFLLKMISACGGTPVLAHPSKIRLNNGETITNEQLDILLGNLKEFGLKGLEVCNLKNDNNNTEFLVKMCEKYNLIPVEGADFHFQDDVLSFDTQIMNVAKFYDEVQKQASSYSINNIKEFHSKYAKPILDIPNKSIREDKINDTELTL